MYSKFEIILAWIFGILGAVVVLFVIGWIVFYLLRIFGIIVFACALLPMALFGTK